MLIILGTFSFKRKLPDIFTCIQRQSTENQKQATKRDNEMQILIDIVLKGWPQRRAKVPPEEKAILELSRWNNFRRRNIIQRSKFDSTKIFKERNASYPSWLYVACQRLVILERCGVCEVKQTVRNCTVCAHNQRANVKEPLIPGIIPDRPWSRVSADIMELSCHNW